MEINDSAATTPRRQLLEEWRFPIGGKVVTLKIEGAEPVDVQDMEALFDASRLFYRQVKKRQCQAADPDYSI